MKAKEITGYWKEMISVAAGLLIIAFSMLYVSGIIPFLVPVLNIAGGLVAAVPPALAFYSRFRMQKEIEQNFVIFINDLTDGIDSGMSLPMALRQCSRNRYGALSPHVNRLAAQVDWGIPFNKTLQTFGKSIESLVVRRAVRTIIETYKVGGKISDTLNAVGKSLVMIEKIKKERSSSVRSQVMMSYIIYFVFIFILIAMQTFLIPSLTADTPAAGIALTTQKPINRPSPEIYQNTFTMFILIQGFFAGLVTGKMAEGSIKGGLKHSMLLIFIGYSLFSLAIQFQANLF